MRKMYFAMIPKRSFLESAFMAAAVGAGLIYGARKLLGDEKFNEYKAQLKKSIVNSGSKDFDADYDSGDDSFTSDSIPNENTEEAILERIRKASAKGVEKIFSRD